LSLRQRRIQEKIRTRRNIKTISRVLAALALILAIGGSMLFLYKSLATWLIGVEPVKYGELEERFTARAIVIKKETVVKAPARGRFENQVREGERVRKGSVVGYFYQEGSLTPQPFLVSGSGVVSFKPDGWETVTADYSLAHGDRDIFSYQPRVVNDGSFQYEPGEPMFKVIDNLVPLRLVVEIDRSDMARAMKSRDPVQVVYQNQALGEATCEAACLSGENKQLAVLALNGCNEDLLNARVIEVDCITAYHSGMIIPKKALLRQNGGYAVFRIKKGRIEMRGVKVKAVGSDQAVVEGLDEGDTVITTPDLVTDGMAYR